MTKKKLAETRTEAEEARWFERKQDRLLELFGQAAKEGALRIGGKSVGITLSKKTGAIRKPPSQKVTLRVPADDLERARRRAQSQPLIVHHSPAGSSTGMAAACETRARGHTCEPGRQFRRRHPSIPHTCPHRSGRHRTENPGRKGGIGAG